MRTRKIRVIFAVLMMILLVQLSPSVSAYGEVAGDAETAVKIVKSVYPESLQMIDDAIETLSKGLAGLSAEESEGFLRYFDPGQTGDIDEDYARSVIVNYQKIRRGLNDQLVLVYAPDHDLCVQGRLYATDFSRVYVCSFILTERDIHRIARDLIHEVAHITLFAYDRAYYMEPLANYNALTPRGYATAQLPILGPVFRELARADTLYHPEAYCRYAEEAHSMNTFENDSVISADLRQPR
jgi:hypothetical protein